MRQTTTIKKSYTTDPEYDLKVTLGWELNLWGAMTWAKRQGAASYKASVEDWRAMRMTLVAEVASAYFRLIALDKRACHRPAHAHHPPGRGRAGTYTL